MQNKHLEHPEDSVISGDLNVLNWFTANGNISAKLDGALICHMAILLNHWMRLKSY